MLGLGVHSGHSVVCLATFPGISQGPFQGVFAPTWGWGGSGGHFGAVGGSFARKKHQKLPPTKTTKKY